MMLPQEHLGRGQWKIAVLAAQPPHDSARLPVDLDNLVLVTHGTDKIIIPGVDEHRVHMHIILACGRVRKSVAFDTIGIEGSVCTAIPAPYYGPVVDLLYNGGHHRFPGGRVQVGGYIT